MQQPASHRLTDLRQNRAYQTSGTQVSSLLSTLSHRQTQLKNGKKVKDHNKENQRSIKLLQKEVQGRLNFVEEEKSPFRLKQFEGVKGRLNIEKENNIGGKVECRKNFININYSAVVLEKKDSTNKENALKPRTPLGQIPKYLIDRKIEIAKNEQQRLLNLELSLIPPGMRILTLPERQSRLETLTKRRFELINSLNRMPVLIETLRMKSRKLMFEEQLREVESEIDLLMTRKKVFVDI